MLTELQDKNIDIGQLVEYRADHCRQFEMSEDKRNFRIGRLARKIETLFCGSELSGRKNVLFLCNML
jgi:hypothetical protein